MKSEQDRVEHMSKMEAVGILMQLAYKRTTTRDEVIAIQVACRILIKQFFDHERYWKRKHEPCDRFGGGRETVTFKRVKTDAGAAILGALVALVVGAMGAMTLLLAVSIVTGRALI